MSPRATALSRESISAPEHPYTDRDVREDPRCLDFALAYTATYQGSFGPMRDAQTELLDTGMLSTRTARVVLNCARNDYRVQGRLPVPQHAAPAAPQAPPAAPQRPTLALVPPLPPRPQERVLRRYLLDIRRPIKVKAPYVVGRSAQYVHIVDTDSDRSTAVWRIKGTTGLRIRQSAWRESTEVRLLATEPQREMIAISVKTLCPYPSILHEAELVTFAGMHEVLAKPRHLVLGQPDMLPPVPCPRCLGKGRG